VTRKTLMVLAAGGSLALLLGAWGFQLAGYEPCELCLLQRWPHYIAAGIGVAVLVTRPWRLWGAAGALAALTAAGLGVYHTGVERGWWEGPAACTGSGDALAGLSGGQLLNLDAPVNVVMCDVVQWAFLGLSMASWNVIFSLIFVAIWVRSLRAA